MQAVQSLSDCVKILFITLSYALRAYALLLDTDSCMGQHVWWYLQLRTTKITLESRLLFRKAWVGGWRGLHVSLQHCGDYSSFFPIARSANSVQATYD